MQCEMLKVGPVPYLPLRPTGLIIGTQSRYSVNVCCVHLNERIKALLFHVKRKAVNSCESREINGSDIVQ